jgi:hypothetical protein
MQKLIEKWLAQIFPPSLPEIEDEEELRDWVTFYWDASAQNDPYQRPLREYESSARRLQ